MNVDKFGRHESKLNREILRGPKGDGFKMTIDGNYDIKKNRLCNVEDAQEDSDAINLNVFKSKALLTDATLNCFNARSQRITNVAEAISDNDAVNRKFVKREIEQLKIALETTIKTLIVNLSDSSSEATVTEGVDKPK